MTTRQTIYNELCDLHCDFYMEKRSPKRGGSTYKAGDRIWRNTKQHWPVVSSDLSANHTKHSYFCRERANWIRDDCALTGPEPFQGEEGKCPETMENSNLFYLLQ